MQKLIWCLLWGSTAIATRGMTAVQNNEHNLKYWLHAGKQVNRGIVFVRLKVKMVREYKRFSARKSWTQANLAAAITAVTSGVSTVNRAATEHLIPRNTLKRYLQSPGKDAEQSLGRFQTVFSKEQEAELVAYVIEMEKMFYGITPYEMRSLAYHNFDIPN